MILHLTSQYKGRRVLICGDSVTVTDNAGLINFSTKQLERGCTVDDGKHNNGGYKVEESYDEVLQMILSQVNPDPKNSSKKGERTNACFLYRHRLQRPCLREHES
jgi:hypothetical protein